MLAVLALPRPVSAHGGAVIVPDAAAGPYRVTVIASPSPLRTARTDISVRVVDVAGRLLEGVAVMVVSQRGGSPGAATEYRTIHSNGLYHASDVRFATPGEWTLTVRVEGSAGAGETAFSAGVSRAFLGATVNELLIYAGLPAFLIVALKLLFALKERRQRRVTEATPDMRV